MRHFIKLLCITLLISSCQAFAASIINANPASLHRFHTRAPLDNNHLNFPNINRHKENVFRKSRPLLSLRGGSSETLNSGIFQKSLVPDFYKFLVQNVRCSPQNLFNILLLILGSLTISWKGYDLINSMKSATKEEENLIEKPQFVKSLQARFLIVFWLLRIADWLQGPYFYEVYSSKPFVTLPFSSNPMKMSMALVSQLFLIGFATTGIFGPYMGRFIDTVGRKKGTLLYTLLYALGAYSTTSSSLAVLVLGRIAGGLGTSLLFSAPEAWLVSQYTKEVDAKGSVGRKRQYEGWLGQTFGWAFAGDAMVAILAGTIATACATRFGPSGPFLISISFLFLAAGLILTTWQENQALPITDAPPTNNINNANNSTPQVKKSPTILSAIRFMLSQPTILTIGLIQSLFESAMYIFVLQWPPVMQSVLQQAYTAAATGTAAAVKVPYGTIFSCFMASCLLGSNLFTKCQSLFSSSIAKNNNNNNNDDKHPTKRLESFSTAMLGLAAIAYALLTFTTSPSASHLSPGLAAALVIGSMCCFEVCVGWYFPMMGTLRAQYLSSEYRGIVMNLFGLGLNSIVVTVLLNQHRLGTDRALAIGSVSLGIATVLMGLLSKLNASTTASPVSAKTS